MRAEPVAQACIPLRLGDWTHPADRADRAMLDLCVGPTLDVGCGPGRMTRELGERGHLVLGIDVTHEAVGQTLERGGAALMRDVFGAVPGEGRWATALVADGNIGIGGDPVRLLQRLRSLLDPQGRVVAELAAPGTPPSLSIATLDAGGAVSAPFPWAVVGVDEIEDLAPRAGMRVSMVEQLVTLGLVQAPRKINGAQQFVPVEQRWCAVLEVR